MRLSKHFTLEELVKSATAVKREIVNIPVGPDVENLKRLAAELEKVRAITGAFLVVLSGYRCPILNKIVGGSPSSYHMKGLAADFDPPPGFTHDAFQHKIAEFSDIAFDLVLEEEALDGAHWLHFQIAERGQVPRRRLRDAKLDKQGGAIQRITAG